MSMPVPGVCAQRSRRSMAEDLASPVAGLATACPHCGHAGTYCNPYTACYACKVDMLLLMLQGLGAAVEGLKR